MILKRMPKLVNFIPSRSAAPTHDLAPPDKPLVGGSSVLVLSQALLSSVGRDAYAI